MTITPVQPNIEGTKLQTYRDANPPIKTEGLVKPLPAEGHLVHDTAVSVPKFWLKDIAYDIKAVRDGYRGTANDHQLGRINDVGLKLGGIGIAGVLAARTSNPMLRIMEYVGLGTFLTAMTLYPKIAINAPSRIVQGFDIGKEYIDDQGRKKSVFQDSNYIPFDMYRGEFPDEDLDKIGDSMGLPRDIKNRHDIIKEQMRKVATQNNTLWMLTAGFATPVMTALICCGLEKLIAPAVEKARNARNNSEIEHLLNRTQNMDLSVDGIETNSLQNRIEKIVTNYRGKEIPKVEIDNIIDIMTENVSSELSSGIKEDITKLLRSPNNGFSVSDKTTAEIIKNIENNIPNNGNKELIKRVFVPTENELKQIIEPLTTEGREITPENIEIFKSKLKELYASKVAKESAEYHDFLKAYQNRTVLENISKSFKKSPVNFVSEETFNSIVDFAKIIGDFKKNEKALDKCQNFKFEFTSETVLARSYAKFEKTLLDVLGIKYKDLKQMRVSSDITKEILDKKLTELAKNDVKYQEAIEKLSKVITDMDTKLNGKAVDKSYILDLVNAIENNYNNTAKRINLLGSNKFSKTVDMLVKEDVSTLNTTINSQEELFDFLNGLGKDKNVPKWTLQYAKEHAKGNGSAKQEAISRIFDRYQGAKNSFFRILHSMDFYRTEMPTGGYAKEVAEKAKDTVLGATSSNHTLKLNTVNNPDFYKDTMWKLYGGNINEATTKGMEKSGNILDSFKSYIERFRNVMGNNGIDFKTPEHMVGTNREYSQKSTTILSKFNLVGQNPIDMVKNAADRRFGNQKWLRIASGICAAVFGVTLLAQFSFGKIKNPQNIQKQVSDDTNS